MPRNSSGIYTLPGGNPVTPGDVIEAEWANTTLEDVADALTNSLSRTGAGGMLAPFRIANGSVTAPGLSFLNETNTGLYRSGAGSTWMSVLGVNTVQFSTVGLTVPFGKALTAVGNASVGGTFAVTGATTLASTLAVTGALTATGGVSGNVTGNVTAGSGTSTFNDVVITGSLDMTAGSSATITGLSTPVNPTDAANKAYVDSQTGSYLSLAGGTMSGAIAMGNNKITGLATPTADADGATKAYVDSVAQGLDVKASCRAATVANITLSGAQTIDGVAVIAGDRVLVKDQSTAANNGIYVVAAGSWSRSTDADTWAELVGAFTFIEDGTVNDNTGWVCTSPPGGTLGSTAVTFEQFSGAGQVLAGTGMSKTGNTLNVNTASSSRIVVGSDEIDLATTGVTAATYKSVTVDQWGRVTAGTNPTTLAGFGITDAYTQAQVDSALALKLNLTGGTMSGVIAMGANKITGLADPTLAQDAATKNYIDTIFGSTTTAAASAAAAAASASAASSSATSASSSATAAAGSATSAAASFTAFDNQYLGSKASDPSTNNTGGALVEGNLYWNSTVNEMRVYDGSAWTAAYLPAAGYMDLTTNQTAAGVKTFSSNPILSGGTANGVTYLNGSKVLTSGSALTFDGTNLGVGTASPGQNLEVYGTLRVRSATEILDISAPSGKIDFNNLAGDPLGFSIGSSEQMRLTSTGLGIGTSSPADKLQVLGTIRFGANATYYGTITHDAASTGSNIYNHVDSGGHLFQVGGTTQLNLNNAGNLGLGVTPSAWGSAYKALQLSAGSFSGNAGAIGYEQNAYNNGSNWIYRTTAAATHYETYGGGHYWFNAPSGTAGNAISFTQAMTLDASGNLGVGTTSPLRKLTSGGTSGELVLLGTGADGVEDALIGRISSQTRTSGSASTSSFASIEFRTGGFPWYGTGVIRFLTANGDGTTGAGAERARITPSGGFSVGTTADPGAGAIYATGNITAYYSDDRLKTRLGYIENALDKVDQLQGFYYEANETAQALGYKVKREVGVSAQSVQAVLPEIVSPAPIDQQYLTVDYERLVPLLIEAIKELRAEVNALKGV